MRDRCQRNTSPLHLREEHFERWLFLWQANCRVQLPIDVAPDMIDLAHHIGDKLRLILGVSNGVLN